MQAISALIAAALMAAASMPSAARNAADPDAAKPALHYESAFSDYVSRKDVQPMDWREANAAAGTGGGHGHQMHQGHDMSAMRDDLPATQAKDHSMHGAPSSPETPNDAHAGHHH